MLECYILVTLSRCILHNEMVHFVFRMGYWLRFTAFPSMLFANHASTFLELHNNSLMWPLHTHPCRTRKQNLVAKQWYPFLFPWWWHMGRISESHISLGLWGMSFFKLSTPLFTQTGDYTHSIQDSPEKGYAYVWVCICVGVCVYTCVCVCVCVGQPCVLSFMLSRIFSMGL